MLRAENAMPLAKIFELPKKFSVCVMYWFKLASLKPLISDLLSARLKNAAVLAFCNDTSVPNTGASGVLTNPNKLPESSTTEMVTSAAEPKGRRICARVWLATFND